MAFRIYEVKILILCGTIKDGDNGLFRAVEVIIVKCLIFNIGNTLNLMF